MTARPEILAPVGGGGALLAALAAGADAVYLGLKAFTARMESENFSLAELSRLVELAHQEGRKVYVALNSLLKPGDLASAGRLIAKLTRDARPDALILQDLGAIELARQAGFSGELHLSTLANLTHPLALQAAGGLGAARVILPRELNLEEVRQCAEACPQGLALEVFIHGALCYCVSGRCYWSSYLGGKSGLRGRCVQPCRRTYQQQGSFANFFSCQDLSLDVLTKALMSLERVVSWKIEGRKKGPHYVYHVVAAYKLLRDHPGDSGARNQAEDILAHALGRPRTKATFLPQKQRPPAQAGQPTSSGLFIGKVHAIAASAKAGRPGFGFRPRVELSGGDFLRVGNEEETWHFTTRVSRPVAKGKVLALRPPGGKSPKPGTPVFLIDRREPELSAKLKEWQAKLERCQGGEPAAVDFTPQLPPAISADRRPRPLDMHLAWQMPGRQGKGAPGINALWLTPQSLPAAPKGEAARLWWWLPPVIWPDEEAQWRELIEQALRQGASRFVLGSPWQTGFFAGAPCELIAGPFCNASNAAELKILQDLGLGGAFVSPELSGREILDLPRQSPLPLGAVLEGFWPMGLSRWPLAGVRANQPFTSPLKEAFWLLRRGQNTWLYPGWPLDLSHHRQELMAAGYVWLAHLHEDAPPGLPRARRSSVFNWDLTLL
ncbi:peptidase U32 [Desulfocarbo indianensis]|nr:peptidase U32 [Desulfocarbo indianensis]